MKPIRACWKQFMICLEATWFVAAFHITPMHDPGLGEFQRPVRVCVRKGASVLSCLLMISPHTQSPAQHPSRKSPGFPYNQKTPSLCPSALPRPPFFGARRESTSFTMEAPSRAQEYQQNTSRRIHKLDAPQLSISH